MALAPQHHEEPRQEIYDAYSYIRRAEVYYDIMDAVNASSPSEKDKSTKFITRFLNDNNATLGRLFLQEHSSTQPTEENVSIIQTKAIHDAAAMTHIILAHDAMNSDHQSIAQKRDDVLDEPTGIETITSLIESLNLIHDEEIDIAYTGNADVLRYTTETAERLKSESSSHALSPETLALAAQFNELKAEQAIENFYEGTKEHVSTESYPYHPNIESGVLDNLRDLTRNAHSRYELQDNPEAGVVRKFWESNVPEGNTPPISQQIWDNLLQPYHLETNSKTPEPLDIGVRTLRLWLKDNIASTLSSGARESDSIAIRELLDESAFNQRTKTWKDVADALNGEIKRRDDSGNISHDVVEHVEQFASHFSMLFEEATTRMPARAKAGLKKLIKQTLSNVHEAVIPETDMHPDRLTTSYEASAKAV